jgi:tRNA pseudouridine55 synthase
MAGLLILNKPAGPTSHDVVARLRRVLGERRIGHTGTLDPLATGVLLLVIGRATRLARFLSASEKSYEAVIRLGVATDTADAAGAPIGSAFTGVLPPRETVDRALDAFRGSFLQQPPAFSAKKIDGKRSHKLARSRTRAGLQSDFSTDSSLTSVGTEVRLQSGLESGSSGTSLPAPAAVSVQRLAIVGVEGDRVTLSLDCSAGFYVRSLAHDLGQALGTGAHLERLQRTRSGDFTVGDAIDLATAEQDRERARASVVPLASMLPGLRAMVLTTAGVRHAVQGRELGPADFNRDWGFGMRDSASSPPVRLLDPGGELVGIAGAARTPGLLHPFVILM